ncbi:MAG: caspase family protein [Rhodothermales bacterium]|nr:caspase family protein [Rhodothermales bacterium]
MARIYALLAGINDYSQNAAVNLKGCLDDIAFYEDLLKTNYPNELALVKLTDADATRENLIDQFRKHLGQAGKDDVALLVYAGHGARWKAAGAFTTYFPDGYDEGFVCYNSRSKPDAYDLGDKEIALLLKEVERNNPHIAVILDCCHSGSATRGAAEVEGALIRATLTMEDERPLESYLHSDTLRIEYAGALKRGELAIPKTKHILLAACDRTQSAHEEKRRGLFSYSLQQVFTQHGVDLSYAELFSRTRATMRDQKKQDPQFETYDHFNAYTTFLGSKVMRQKRHLVFFDTRDQAWMVECGAVHNLPSDADKPAELTLYNDAGKVVGQTRTTQVGIQKSAIAMPAALAGNPAAQFKASITSLPIPPEPVYIEGPKAQVAALKKALDPSIGATFVDAAEGTRYMITARDGEYRLIQRDTGLFVQGVKGYGEAGAMLTAVLQPVIQWERALRLHNTSTRLDTSKVEIRYADGPEQGANVYEIGLTDAAGRPFPDKKERVLEIGQSNKLYNDNEVVVTYKAPDGVDDESYDIPTRFLIRNRTSQPLYALLLYFSREFKIRQNANEPIPPGQEFSVLDQGSLFLDAGLNEETVWYKLIVSTERIDDQLLTMDGFELGNYLVATRGERRHEDKKLEPTNDWFTKTWRVKIVRQNKAVGEAPVPVEALKLTIDPHPSIKAKVNTTAVSTGTRGATSDGAYYDVLERAGLSLFSPGRTRGDAAPAHVLELTDIDGDAGLAENPLMMTMQADLDENEVLLPLAFDGEQFVLVGDSERTPDGAARIRIDEIPEATTNRRSLGKALKLYFFKAYLARDVANINRLGWVKTTADGLEIIPKGAKTQVQEAKNILLVIHGIIGDTKTIVPGLADIAGGLQTKFDTILTYDYENLNTPIEETALTLKKQLEDAGFGPDDGKKLTILAHSMGGLVSRCFIERLGGHTFVDHLVMAGTPNGGSPFGEFGQAREAMKRVTGLVVNFVPSVIPFLGSFVNSLHNVLEGSEQITPTLEQMNPSSTFLALLNDASANPGIRYSIVAGDMGQVSETEQRGFLKKFLVKVGHSKTASALFDGAPNDIAVSVASIKQVSATRTPAPVIRDAPCHHLSYFNSEAGVRVLSQVEW